MNCGAALSGAIQAAHAGENAGAHSAQTLDQFIPHELMARLEAARAHKAMLGERRIITMLFCDVQGSTAAAEKVDPETWAEIVNGVFEYMIRPIYKYEGTVPRLMGDAILAFFGAPIAHEDDPQRAVLAGLEIQSGIQPYLQEIQQQHGLKIGLRVGVHTGLVVVGEIGSDLRLEYTAIGDAINLAAHMEQTAAVGTIQISEKTSKLVAPFFELAALGEIAVKGKAAPVKTYRVQGVKATPGQLRGLQGLSSPLVGREAQLAFLLERLERLGQGTGSFVAVIGEAGLGKSTLIAEMKNSNPQPGCAWLRGEAQSYARSFSYYLWRQIIRQSIHALEGDLPAEVGAKLRLACTGCGLAGDDIPFLEALLSVESEDSLQIIAGYEGEALVQTMVEAARRYLGALAEQRPLAIVLDDFHWADEASINLLVNLAGLAGSRALLFVCILRPEKNAPCWQAIEKIQSSAGGAYHAITLEPLPPEKINALLANLLGRFDLPQKVRDTLAAKAEGNPFFIEELIRSLIQTGRLVYEDGRWREAGEGAKIALPDTLRGVLEARHRPAARNDQIRAAERGGDWPFVCFIRVGPAHPVKWKAGCARSLSQGSQPD